MLGLGYVFKITLLLVNAIAILNEERFLARSELSTGVVDRANMQSDGQREGTRMPTRALELSTTPTALATRRDRA